MKDLLHHARIVFFFTPSHKHFKREEKDQRERLEKKKEKKRKRIPVYQLQKNFFPSLTSLLEHRLNLLEDAITSCDVQSNLDQTKVSAHLPAQK